MFAVKGRQALEKASRAETSCMVVSGCAAKAERLPCGPGGGDS